GGARRLLRALPGRGPGRWRDRFHRQRRPFREAVAGRPPGSAGSTMIPGLGTALNTGTVLAGAAIGLSLGRVIPASLQRTIRAGLGLFVSVYGIQVTFKNRNPLILLVRALVCDAVV